MNKKNILNYLLLFGIGITWGSQFLFNNIAIQTLPPYAVAASRTTTAGLCLYILMLFITNKNKNKNKSSHSNRSEKNSQLKFSIIIKYLLIAFLEAVLPFYLIAWGQQYIDSSITAILIATIPIFTALLIKIFIAHEKLSLGMLLSIFFGFAGLLVLLWPSLAHANLTHLLAEGAILTGALSFSISLVLIKTLPNTATSPIKMTRNIFLIASVPLILNILIFHPNSFAAINYSSFFSVLALGMFCSACAYTMFVTLINSGGAAFASLSNYLVPVVGTILGVILLGDNINVNMIVALVIIMGSLVIAKLPILNR